MEDYAREPCPWRIIDDCGGAFSMGVIGGGLFSAIYEARNAPWDPKGMNRRLMGSLVRIKERAPVLGGQFAAWGICFSTFDCTFSSIRQKEDPWNSILSGFMTNGVMAARSGPKKMLGNAVVGGILLGLIEGLGIIMNNFASQNFRPVDPREEHPPEDPSSLGQSENKSSVWG